VVSKKEPSIIKAPEGDIDESAKKFFGCRYESSYMITASDPEMGKILILIYVGFDFTYINISH